MIFLSIQTFYFYFNWGKYKDENSFVSRNIGISEYAEFIVLPEFLRNLNFFDKIQFQEFMYWKWKFQLLKNHFFWLFHSIILMILHWIVIKSKIFEGLAFDGLEWPLLVSLAFFGLFWPLNNFPRLLRPRFIESI